MAININISLRPKNPGRVIEQALRDQMVALANRMYRNLRRDAHLTELYVKRRTPVRTGALRESVEVEIRRLGQWSGLYLSRYNSKKAGGYYAQWVPAARNLIRGRKLKNYVRRQVRKAINDAIKEVNNQ